MVAVWCAVQEGQNTCKYYINTRTHTLMLTQRSRGVLEGEILANQRRWIGENMEKRSGREADSY